MQLKTLCIFGTRPEAIKMAPLIKAFAAHSAFANKVCVTGQHQQMLQSVLDLFNIQPDFNLEVMETNQDLGALTARILTQLAVILKEESPELVLVHGDTTTTLAASLCAYYHQIPVAHVEAGLRTGDMYAPWPEELNRKLTAGLAALHFAPTMDTRVNLLQEGVSPNTIFVTGNTVIDALSEMSTMIESNPERFDYLHQAYPFLNSTRKMILVTGHRRENFGEGLLQICQALTSISKRFPEVDIVYPVHLNPNVHDKVHDLLAGIANIYLIAPIDYLSFVYFMKKSYLILTDSGGIQEEAPALGKPVLVMREITERPEAVAAGTAKIVGTKVQDIVSHVSDLLCNSESYAEMSGSKNPYGDGHAAKKIVNILAEILTKSATPYEERAIL